MHPLESKNQVLRKGTAYALQLTKLAYRVFAPPEAYRRRPPIIVNSIPKSGTHLLMQLARAVPGSRYFGTFIAHAWSVTLRERSQREILFRLKQLVPGEVVGAHLKYDPVIAQYWGDLPAVHLFIYRDPRDVVLSEAPYLAEMNRWHRLHRVIKRMPDDETRIRALIQGIPGLYPDIGARISAYLGWLDDSRTIAVRYEDLMGEKLSDTVLALARSICEQVSLGMNPVDLARRMEAAIAPQRSPTFREGGIDKWRGQMSDLNLALMERYAGLTIERLGYPRSRALTGPQGGGC